MLILGINFGHDASVTVIRNGTLVAAIEEEKVTRVKQDFGWPRASIERLFREHQLRKEEVAVIAFGGHVHKTMRRSEIAHHFRKSPFTRLMDKVDRILMYLRVRSAKISAENNERLISSLIKREGFAFARVTFHNHHLCHAASAYYASPIDVDLVITCDGQGDAESYTCYAPTSNGLQHRQSIDHKVSLGQFYGAITHLLGFRPNRHEGKITGLAAYGKPSPLVEVFEDLWRSEGGRLTRYPFDRDSEEFKRLGLHRRLPMSTRINVSPANLNGEYHKTYYILLGWLRQHTSGYSREDIAYACQAVTDRLVTKLVAEEIRTLGIGRPVSLALAGGVFANVRVNQKILELNEVRNLFVQPAMGDAGIGMGAAILEFVGSSEQSAAVRCFAFDHTFWGPDYTRETSAFLESARQDSRLEVISMAKPAEYIATQLASNKIIGFWDGRMEWGPRALGARSILLNTFDRTVNASLNQRLDRTEFMPFAPVVLDTVAQEYFPSYDPSVPAAKYMTITYETAPEHRERLQAVVHVDGTARPQVIARNDQPYYYDILAAFYRITGCGALVNTSFNAHEEPIVSSQAIALGALLGNRVDALVIEESYIRVARKSA